MERIDAERLSPHQINRPHSTGALYTRIYTYKPIQKLLKNELTPQAETFSPISCPLSLVLNLLTPYPFSLIFYLFFYSDYRLCVYMIMIKINYSLVMCISFYRIAKVFFYLLSLIRTSLSL